MGTKLQFRASVQAKYPLMKTCDMLPDLKEEVQDICITLVEKYPTDYEKCTQVNPPALFLLHFA